MFWFKTERDYNLHQKHIRVEGLPSIFKKSWLFSMAKESIFTEEKYWMQIQKIEKTIIWWVYNSWNIQILFHRNSESLHDSQKIELYLVVMNYLFVKINNYHQNIQLITIINYTAYAYESIWYYCPYCPNRLTFPTSRVALIIFPFKLLVYLRYHDQRNL